MPQGTVPGTPQNPLLSFLPLVFIFGIFYFLLILPQQRKQKKHQDVLDALKVGDEIVTLGGLYGKIVEVKAETFVVEIAPKIQVRISRSAVSHKI
ncbi:MAG: preprotein translocase subunit YajC [Candidatus Omnitrophota bacterium]